MADHLGFKVQRTKGDQCRLLMPNVEVKDTLTDIELTDTLTHIEAWLRKANEENLDPRGVGRNPKR
jgi:7,8-dihydro-6-hydroxymethylpterin-pyrophosphokinase